MRVQVDAQVDMHIQTNTSMHHVCKHVCICRRMSFEGVGGGWGECPGTVSLRPNVADPIVLCVRCVCVCLCAHVCVRKYFSACVWAGDLFLINP